MINQGIRRAICITVSMANSPPRISLSLSPHRRRRRPVLAGCTKSSMTAFALWRDETVRARDSLLAMATILRPGFLLPSMP